MSGYFSAERPFQCLYIDLIGPYRRSKKGNIGAIVLLDNWTKFPFLRPIRRFSSEAVVSFLKSEIFPLFGTPEMIISDNGKQFKCNHFANFLKDRGVRHICTALYSSQANASERVNRSVITRIRSYISSDHSDWDAHLQDVAESLRSSYHHTTGYSPYYSVFGQQMVSHASHPNEYKLLSILRSPDYETMDKSDRLKMIRRSVLQNIVKAFENSSKRYNLKSNCRTFSIGETVYRRNFSLSDAGKRFCSKFSTKFVKSIVVAKGTNIYELQDEASGRREFYHAKDIQSASI